MSDFLFHGQSFLHRVVSENLCPWEGIVFLYPENSQPTKREAVPDFQAEIYFLRGAYYFPSSGGVAC
jgi:hypothetical protein